jgi:hypothetical protein
MLEVPNLLPKDGYQDDVELIHWYPQHFFLLIVLIDSNE